MSTEQDGPIKDTRDAEIAELRADRDRWKALAMKNPKSIRPGYIIPPNPAK